MEQLSKLVSYVFHPLFMPLGGTLAFFTISPKFNPPEVQKSVLFSVVLLTLVIPMLFFFLLKSMGWITSIYLEKISERKVPVYLYIILNYIVILKVVPYNYTPELYYFFVGIVGALISCLVLVYFKFKASMHLMGLSGLLVFVIGLAFHYEINITMGIGLLMAITGTVASARLYLKAHSATEVLVGLIIGAVPQLITFERWL